ncbi:hypothetical protein DESC_720345 [Desulfosarcina cetonica]|nr:hypothetical protein DESC_720345 [Desulfosarcina cetonica]
MLLAYRTVVSLTEFNTENNILSTIKLCPAGVRKPHFSARRLTAERNRGGQIRGNRLSGWAVRLGGQT